MAKGTCGKCLGWGGRGLGGTGYGKAQGGRLNQGHGYRPQGEVKGRPGVRAGGRRARTQSLAGNSGVAAGGKGRTWEG